MTPVEREAVRAQALEVLHGVRAWLGLSARMELDKLIEQEARQYEPRAEMAVFIVVAQVLVKHGCDWMDVFAPISRFDGAELRAILDAAEIAIREA